MTLSTVTYTGGKSPRNAAQFFSDHIFYSHGPLLFMRWLFFKALFPWAEDTDDHHGSAIHGFTANSGITVLKSTRIRGLCDWGRLNRTFSVGAQKLPDQQLRVIRQFPDLKSGSHLLSSTFACTFPILIECLGNLIVFFYLPLIYVPTSSVIVAHSASSAPFIFIVVDNSSMCQQGSDIAACIHHILV